MTALVWVEKDGEVVEVHPDALKEHLRLKWKLTDATAAHFEEPVIAPEPRRGPGRPRRVAE